MTYQRGQNIVCFHVRRIMENATRWRRQEKACNFYNQLESHSLFSTLSSFTLPFLKSWPLLYQAARLVENKPSYTPKPSKVIIGVYMLYKVNKQGRKLEATEECESFMRE